MFKYAHTLTKLNYNQHEINLLCQHVDHYLISLIDGLRQASFGIDTLIKTAENIENLRKQFKSDIKWFIDSGGYSIIVGDVSPRDMSKFMECYNYYLDNYAQNNCDYILSLDIPILLKYPNYNTVKYITDMNYLSCSNSKEILDKNKSLYDKFVFIWQFKTPKQYKIWCNLYDDIFGNCKELKHFAIGGQVGLRGITGINFSPFIATSYQIMDILYEKNDNYEHILHLLGIYGLHDRFLMGIMDRLFNKYYLNNRQNSVKITFDTVNHIITGLYRVRELKSIIIEDNQIIYDYNHLIIDKFHLLIEDSQTLKEVQKNLQEILEDERISDTSVVATLEVIKNQMFNKIMDAVIDKYNIVQLFVESINFNKFKNLYTPIHIKLEKDFPYIFGNRLDKHLLNFQLLYSFHDWWLKGRDKERFAQMMKKYITMINFPSDLSD